jgi:hypothetical protein
MRYSIIVLILAALTIGVNSCGKCKKKAPPKTDTAPAQVAEQPAEQQPLLLDDEPLLLDDEPLLLNDELTDEDLSNMADNSRCHVCHINYQTEDIAVDHAKAGMGCNHCHGPSDEHIADESWASGGNGTAPDKMFVRDAINPFCMTCHPKEKIDLLQHKPLFAETDKPKVCTDCHGKHRLHTRKCKWK